MVRHPSRRSIMDLPFVTVSTAIGHRRNITGVGFLAFVKLVHTILPLVRLHIRILSGFSVVKSVSNIVEAAKGKMRNSATLFSFTSPHTSANPGLGKAQGPLSQNRCIIQTCYTYGMTNAINGFNTPSMRG